MTNAHEIASNYIATWNATDAKMRAALIADHWASEPHYVDPLMGAWGLMAPNRSSRAAT